MYKIFKLRIFLIFIFFTILPTAAKAYGGPGAALGAIIVFITVVLAFIASTIIGILDFFKKKFKQKRSRKENKNKNEIDKK